MNNERQHPSNSSESQVHKAGPKFGLGHIVATPAALELLEKHGVNQTALLSRHARGDWGDLCKSDQQANDMALQDGSRIFSAYVIGPDKFFVITEQVGEDQSRASTCIMRAEDY
jgi:hypothetical protein